MKLSACAVTAAALLHPGIADADVVKQEVPDTIAGKGFGAPAGFMLGATGGPFGAEVGALVGGWSVAAVRKAAGLHGFAYVIQRQDGSEQTVRSPGRLWRAGNEVEVLHGRLIDAHQNNN
jgi:hypothetical protein